MAEQAKTAVEIKEFPGQINNADRLDTPPGAAELQINLCALKVGEMTTRMGIKEVTFEN